MSDHFEVLVVTVPSSDVELASDIMWTAGAQAVEEMPVDDRVELLTDLGDAPIDLWTHAVTSALGAQPSDWSVITRLVDRSVADNWKQFAPVTTVRSVRIVPAWNTNERQGDEVLIDPGGSFGMGDHPTTRATLSLALDLAARGDACASVLDLGCGSGVLSIALALNYGSRVVAVDIAPAAIEATLANVALNGVAENFVIARGDINCVMGQYELVLANILAPVLLADRDAILRRVASRGTLILSGFTDTRLYDIVESYESAGCRQRNLHEVDDWYGLELQCP